jgi:hypothetical protein
MIRMILALGAMLALTVTGRAEITKVKGKGEVVYKGIFSTGSADERAAIVEAKKNALSRYTASFDSARYELYKKIESDVIAHLDDYVTDYTQLDQQTDKTSKRYTVIIEASINTTILEQAIQKSTDAAASKTASTYMTFVFVAREQASRKAFDVEINDNSKTGTEKNAVAEDGQSAEHAVETSALNKKTTGGNTETKADELAYRVTTVTEVDNAVNSVLTKARYETVDPSDAGLDMEAFKNDFSSGSDISSATRAAAIKTLKEKEISYLALANMDVGLPEKDEVSGMIRVYVTVTAKVTLLTSKFPKTVASIAGKPFAGLGENAQVAKQNALNEAATRSAAELVDQLRMKNVH